MPNINDLKFVRVINPLVFSRIPPELFEQIKKREWEVQRLYAYGPIFITNPFNFIWVMQDITLKIKGVLWATIDPIEDLVYLALLTVDLEYQKPRGAAIKRAVEHLSAFRDEYEKKEGIKLRKKIMALTQHPKPIERAGFTRSKRVMMEIKI